MEIRIRQLDPTQLDEDAKLVAQLAQEIWTEHYTPMLGAAQVAYMLEQLQSPARIIRDITEAGFRYWLAEDAEAGIPIGYCGAAQEPNRLFLSTLYVLTAYRTQGVARQLLSLLEEWRAAAQLPTIQLAVNKDNHGSIAAYEKLGFRTVRSVVTDIGGGFVTHDYIMEWSSPGSDQVATMLLWRHGVTGWNAMHRFQGSNADPPLSHEGTAQAQLAAPGVASWEPDIIVCSPQLRARQTCAAVEALVDLSCQVDDRLRELDVGSWSGLTMNQVMALDPQYGVARDMNLDYRHGGTGETATELGTRVAAALNDWAEDGKTVLVTSHGWALQAGVAAVLGWDYSQSRCLKIMRNCALSVITRVNDRWRIDRWNVRS